MPDLSGIRIRNFQEKDTESIIGFKKESAKLSFPGIDIDTELFRRRLLKRTEKNPNLVKVAEDNGRVIGYVFMDRRKSITGPVGYISHVFVAEPYRKSGLGLRLAKEAEYYLRSLGIRKLRVTVTKTNTLSLNFCRKLGYEEKRLILEKTLN